MKKHNCESCKFRAIYETKPHSLLGRIWKWHIKWCPGWKSYTSSLDQDTLEKLQEDLRLNK